MASLAVQKDGCILVGGYFDHLGGQPRTRIGRLHPDGSLDTSFTPEATNGGVEELVLQMDGKILVGGSFSRLAGQPCGYLGRLYPNGILDASFNPWPNEPPVALAVQSDGKILVGGAFTLLNGQPHHGVGRLNADGSLDATLNPAPGEIVWCLASQADGRILVGRFFRDGDPRTSITRLHLDGSTDATFSSSANNSVLCVAVQPDGKILVGGYFTMLGGQPRKSLGRLNADGSVDTAFSPEAGTGDYSVHCLALQSDGKIVVGGAFSTLGGQPRFDLGRLNPDGSLDTNFNVAAAGYCDDCPPGIFSLVVQPDGKILVGGGFTMLAEQPRASIGRLNTDGSLDPSFDPGANSFVECLALQPDGRILVGGSFRTLAGQARAGIGRLNSDGSLDASFDAGAVVGNEYGVFDFYSLGVQVDGRILVGGYFTMIGGQPRTNICLLNPDGSLDATFDPRAYHRIYPSYVYSLGLQADGKILVGGNFTVLAGQARTNLGRLTSGSAALQSLGIDASGTAVTWLRSGSGPEVEQVTFELSLDRTNYLLLGSATRIPGGWQLAGISLPTGQDLCIRARGRTPGGIYNGSSGLIESVAQFYRIPSPQLVALPASGGATFQFVFNNPGGHSYTVFATTNVVSPAPIWEVLGPPAPMGGGIYQFTDPAATQHARRFYQLRWP